MVNLQAPYKFRRGATVRIALEAATGDPAQVTAITAEMRPRLSDGTLKEDDEISCAVAFYAAQAPNPAGWFVTVNAPASAALAPGQYAIVATLTVGGDTVITDPAPIWLED